jgi:hypothetical protein
MSIAASGLAIVTDRIAGSDDLRHWTATVPLENLPRFLRKSAELQHDVHKRTVPAGHPLRDFS